MRYLDHDISAGRNIKRWLKRDYEARRLVLQEPPFEEAKDQSEIFTMVREPYQRWWSGIRDFMYLLPWYSWWENERIMEQWPHFHRATFRIHDVMEQIKPRHMIKVDDGLNDRIIAFARKHRLLCFGNIPHRGTSGTQGRTFRKWRRWGRNNYRNGSRPIPPGRRN